MTTINIKTTGTHCPSCSMLIEMNVGDLPGVSEVRASHADGVATVTFDPSAVDAEAIAEEIRKAGYGAEIQA
jgi:copper chaperone CopZ